jgi:hypothetical protein
MLIEIKPIATAHHADVMKDSAAPLCIACAGQPVGNGAREWFAFNRRLGANACKA